MAFLLRKPGVAAPTALTPGWEGSRGGETMDADTQYLDRVERCAPQPPVPFDIVTDRGETVTVVNPSYWHHHNIWRMGNWNGSLGEYYVCTPDGKRVFRTGRGYYSPCPWEEVKVTA
jgi:hypothetical protein